MTKTTTTKTTAAKTDPIDALKNAQAEIDGAVAFIAETLAPFTAIENPTERAQAMWMAAMLVVSAKTDLSKATCSVLLNGIKACHNSARTAGKPAYDKATEEFRKAYDKACEPARKAYEEATKAFREQYEEACKPFSHLMGDVDAIEASYKTLRTAMVSMGGIADAPALFNQGRKAKAE